ncbi:hypothetical protein GCM10009555_087280 [Acrocarpospora macrocephala]|uniref:Uncharacterized protein n=1 Tax=Acrocarpospora macrocephala TaxID=150177 RepID=A0A5M3WRM7_9ACTN|nr:hypothetical protein [Acrocarpospora macrocephala]GES08838.1 hypothetical protein Amac_024340 [Acrocarpospora macrocephala]
MRFLKAFGRFWYDFIIGDDWKIAAAVLTALALTAIAMTTGLLSGSILVIVGAVALFLFFVVSMVVDVRK